MTPNEYRALRKVHRATRDPELGRLLLAYELRKRPSSPEQVVQFPFRVVQVYCDAMRTVLSVAECIRRAKATTASGHGKGFPIHFACRQCPRREIHRAMAPGFTPAPYRPFNVQREQKQRQARQKAWKAGLCDPVRTIDSPRGEE